MKNYVESGREIGRNLRLNARLYRLSRREDRHGAKDLTPKGTPPTKAFGFAQETATAGITGMTAAYLLRTPTTPDTSREMKRDLMVSALKTGAGNLQEMADDRWDTADQLRDARRRVRAGVEDESDLPLPPRGTGFALRTLTIFADGEATRLQSKAEKLAKLK